MDGWKTTFLLGWPIFRCYLSLREGTCSFSLIFVHPSFLDSPSCLRKAARQELKGQLKLKAPIRRRVSSVVNLATDCELPEHLNIFSCFVHCLVEQAVHLLTLSPPRRKVSRDLSASSCRVSQSPRYQEEAKTRQCGLP